MKTITITLAIAVFFTISARGQGFQNLDFESAQNLPGNPGSGELVPVTNALPGWTAYDGILPGALALSSIYYVSNTLNVAGSVELEGGSLALSGNLSVELYLNSAISQTGSVPANAGSLQFEAKGLGPDDSLGASALEVTLGGQNLSYSALSDGPDYIVYGANIPAGMDNEMEELIFSCEGIGSGQVLLDNIEFSSMSVPEPSTCALLGLGVILLGLRRCRKPL